MPVSPNRELRHSTLDSRKEGITSMLSTAILSLIIALIAMVFGITGLAGAATNVAWILFVIFLASAVLGFIGVRRNPV
jgi:uncharacterized membrane protein YtjA (UPF0391 family)